MLTSSEPGRELDGFKPSSFVNKAAFQILQEVKFASSTAFPTASSASPLMGARKQTRRL